MEDFANEILLHILPLESPKLFEPQLICSPIPSPFVRSSLISRQFTNTSANTPLKSLRISNCLPAKITLTISRISTHMFQRGLSHLDFQEIMYTEMREPTRPSYHYLPSALCDIRTTTTTTQTPISSLPRPSSIPYYLTPGWCWTAIVKGVYFV